MNSLQLQICLVSIFLLITKGEMIETEMFEDISIHRVRRATQTFDDNVTYICDTKTLPQPTLEYPLILFENENYNNCTTDGVFMRVRANDFVKWGENTPGPNQRRLFQWRSMLMLPSVNITFRACCPSGNNFVSSVSDWSSTADLHLSVMGHPELKSNRGIWYERWLHWVMSFYLRIDGPIDSSSIQSCGECYFGQCGLAGTCECADGYSGQRCDQRPTNDTYPTEKKPLVLFKEINFQGSYLPVSPADFKKFATNYRETRLMEYNSMRVLFNRTVTFARNIVYQTVYTPGNDIRDISEFMAANSNIGNGIWFNYDQSIALDFFVRVESTPQCFNCSTTNGVCYTGTCICLNGVQGENCDT